ncbi:hypothetical protein [Psychromonas sp. GE-S-Ul-11]
MPNRVEAINLFNQFKASNALIEDKYGIHFSKDFNKYPENSDYYINNSDVDSILNLLINNLKGDKLEDRDATVLRDIALELEKDNKIETALVLMEMAKKIRPNGSFINKKISEYKTKLPFSN